MTSMEGNFFSENLVSYICSFSKIISDLVKKKLQFNFLNIVILLPEVDLESFGDVPWINKDEDTEPVN